MRITKLVYYSAHKVGEEIVILDWVFSFHPQRPDIPVKLILSVDSSLEEIQNAVHEAYHIGCMMYYDQPTQFTG